MHLLLDGLGIPESTRWHGGRAWVCNWGAGEVIAVTDADNHKVVARFPGALPLSIDWLPDGTLLVVDGPACTLRTADSTTVAELGAALGAGRANEIVVASNGNTYVNGGAGAIALITPDGEARRVADGLTFPNGMALLADEGTLICADSHAQALFAYGIDDDGLLSPGRVWAQLETAPDGICVDAEGAIWVASVPAQACLRVLEGGEITETVGAGRGCFACMLGGEDGRDLYIATAEWLGMEKMMRDGPGTTGQLVVAPGQRAPHAGRP